MRVFISADIEGVTGLVAWSQCGRPDGEHYDFAFARRMMTHDVNAAIRGARAGGATEIVVKDSHGNGKNLLIDQLEPGTELISGTGSGLDGMMCGIDDSFGCAFLIGYHAMAGTPEAVMEHTINGTVHRIWINDMPAGEIAMAVATASAYGVPTTLLTSDWAGCEEFSELHIVSKRVAVKRAIGRFRARLLHPDQTGHLIRKAAEEAVRETKIKPWSPEEPVTIRLEQNGVADADLGAQAPGWERTDGYTLEHTVQTWQEAQRALWLMFGVAARGRESNA